MNKTLTLVLVSCIFLSNNTYAYKYALGSCLDQDLEQPIWAAIEKQDIDGFIFLGDNVYGDQKSGELGKLKKAYKKQKNLVSNKKSGIGRRKKKNYNNKKMNF